MALGADRWRVVSTCVRGPLLQTSLGVGLGLVASLLVGQAINSQLYGMEGFDLDAYATAMLSLVASAIVAAALPARRAAATNPSAVLRGE
jgi:ABC-type antimicrobial peptide transport system permease subunit